MSFNEIAIQRFPNEAGAVFINGVMYEVPNTSSDPTKFMQFSGEHLLNLEIKYGPIEKYIHSHIVIPGKIIHDPRYQPQWASHQDMQMWISLNKPFGIVATDGNDVTETLWYDDSLRAPLVGREFTHGLHDCYSIVRDYYYLEKEISLPNFPRGWDWWNHGEDLYLENFDKAGFYEIPRNEATIGDVILYRIGAPMINHASVIVGPNGILHHLVDRQSRVEQRSKWSRVESIALRYRGINNTQSENIC